MNSLAIIGTQWGDEGKGKITNYLAKDADFVVRYQGGNNAGHSIFVNNKKFSLHLLPSGIFYKNVVNVLANGVVIDLFGLVDELNELKANNFKDFKLLISERAHVVFPYHKKIDGLFEELKAKDKIGTTKQGIGPAYTDKSSRIGIRIIDLFDDKYLAKRLKENILIKNNLLKSFKIEDQIDFDSLYQKILVIRKIIKPFVKDTAKIIYDALNQDKKVLFEGAQGVLLCLDHGTYPFVTSSSPTASSIPLNVGIPCNYINEVLGIVKAYTTRVGRGVFLTEITDQISEKIRIKGKEFGTTTGRARRIGWFDATLIRYAKRINGLTKISVTLLDVLSGFEELKIAINYKINGKIIDGIPLLEEDLLKTEVEYLILKGWKEDISKIKTFAELPENAKKYLRAIEKYGEVKIAQFSVGPKAEQTIDLIKIW
ncbi:/ purA / Adenylosuccinate synthetase /:203919 Forward [Candidatus Hepatoplasma crinochetorum]|uniref:Adenylosuccinate synthetase n=1 Tax=Candidatus Hepatoplasma crinochetorum TaxID=295596 RepID=A0A0G7ZMB9_9MOLU|nr:/ purA / Adenylosuccinate synthetase /:203919 Forward [Candidatus Hepatoplasma crinochetorum]